MVDEEGESPARIAGAVFPYEGIVGEGGGVGGGVKFGLLQGGNLDLVVAQEVLQLHSG